MNQLNPINSLNILNSLNEISFPAHSLQRLNQPEITSKSTFEGFFDAAVKLLDQTNQMQIQNERLTLDFATGKTDDILSVILAMQRAHTSLNFTVQVTNKVIEAYREIMRITT